MVRVESGTLGLLCVAGLGLELWGVASAKASPDQSSSPCRGSKLQSHKLNTIPIGFLTL